MEGETKRVEDSILPSQTSRCEEEDQADKRPSLESDDDDVVRCFIEAKFEHSEGPVACKHWHSFLLPTISGARAKRHCPRTPRSIPGDFLHPKLPMHSVEG